jgi:hypothetical protein
VYPFALHERTVCIRTPRGWFVYNPQQYFGRPLVGFVFTASNEEPYRQSARGESDDPQRINYQGHGEISSRRNLRNAFNRFLAVTSRSTAE